MDAKALAAIVSMGCVSVCIVFFGLRWRGEYTGLAAKPTGNVRGSLVAGFEQQNQVMTARYFTDPKAERAMNLAAKADQAGLADFGRANPGILTARGRGGITLAHLALMQKDVRAFVTLLAAGVDKHAGADNGISPLMAAAMVPEVRFLQAALAGGARLDQQDKSGRSALHLAVLHRQVANVRLLLSAGANPNLPDSDGNTPWLAAFQGRRPNREIATLLRDYGASNLSKDKSGLTARDYALAFDDPALLSWFQ